MRAFAAIKSRRMFGRGFDLGKLIAADRQRFGRRLVQLAEAVQHRGGREAGIGGGAHLAGMRATRQRQNAPQHVDIEFGHRQRRPARPRRDMEQDDPAAPALLGGHERCAVFQPSPAARAEFHAGFGQHLPRHGHVFGNRKSAKGAGIGEGRQMLRLGPAHGAAQIAPAGAQFYRHEAAHVFRHARPGKAQEHAAVFDKLLDPRMILADDTSDIDQRQHRHVLLQLGADGALAHIGIGRQRARQVIGAGQQRLLIFDIGGRNEPHLAPLGRRIEQAHRPGRILIGDDKPFRFVAQFQRQLEYGGCRSAGRARNRNRHWRGFRRGCPALPPCRAARPRRRRGSASA